MTPPQSLNEQDPEQCLGQPGSSCQTSPWPGSPSGWAHDTMCPQASATEAALEWCPAPPGSQHTASGKLQGSSADQCETGAHPRGALLLTHFSTRSSPKPECKRWQKHPGAQDASAPLAVQGWPTRDHGQHDGPWPLALWAPGKWLPSCFSRCPSTRGEETAGHPCPVLPRVCRAGTGVAAVWSLAWFSLTVAWGGRCISPCFPPQPTLPRLPP